MSLEGKAKIYATLSEGCSKNDLCLPDFDNQEIFTLTQADAPALPAYEPPTIQGMEQTGFVPSSGNVELQVPSETEKEPKDTFTIGYADFLPVCTKTTRKSTETPVYEDFKVLMSKVNQWLVSNPQYHVIKCEVLDWKVNKQGVLDVNKTIFQTEGRGAVRTFLRGIRLWITYNTSNEPIQEIYYMNVVPHINNGKVELLDETLLRLNGNLKQNPVPGKILNIDCSYSIHYHLRGSAALNPDECFKRYDIGQATTCVQVLKIFYVTGKPEVVEIDLVDFFPECTHVTSHPTLPHFEQFSNTNERFNSWLQKSQSTCTFLSVQTMVYNIINNIFEDCSTIDTRRMAYDAVMYSPETNVNFLRAACIRSRPCDTSMLSCKSFYPTRLQSYEAEPLPTVVARLNKWLALTGAQLENIETMALPFSPYKGEAGLELEKSYMSVSPTTTTNWINVIRVYIRGDYKEPDECLFPQVPFYNQKVEEWWPASDENSWGWPAWSSSNWSCQVQ